MVFSTRRFPATYIFDKSEVCKNHDSNNDYRHHDCDDDDIGGAEPFVSVRRGLVGVVILVLGALDGENVGERDGSLVGHKVVGGTTITDTNLYARSVKIVAITYTVYTKFTAQQTHTQNIIY